MPCQRTKRIYGLRPSKYAIQFGAETVNWGVGVVGVNQQVASTKYQQKNHVTVLTHSIT